MLKNMDCGYSLEPPWRGGSNVLNKKNIKKNSAENFQFVQLKKNLYITWACFCNGIKPVKIKDGNFYTYDIH